MNRKDAKRRPEKNERSERRNSSRRRVKYDATPGWLRALKLLLMSLASKPLAVRLSRWISWRNWRRSAACRWRDNTIPHLSPSQTQSPDLSTQVGGLFVLLPWLILFPDKNAPRCAANFSFWLT